MAQEGHKTDGPAQPEWSNLMYIKVSPKVFPRWPQHINKKLKITAEIAEMVAGGS